jgi:membrane-bound lytic murein transglycosylase B
MHASPLLLAFLAAAFSTSALAAPSSPSAAPAAAADFSFAQWVEDIIADPAGAHLSPLEAVEAKNAAVAASTSPLQKRVNCDRGWARANVRSPFPFPLPFRAHQQPPRLKAVLS